MLAFSSYDIADRGLRMYHLIIRDKIPLLAVATIAMMVGLLVGSRRVSAQWRDESALRVSDFPIVERVAASDVESSSINAPDGPAADAMAADGSDDSGPRPGSEDDSDVEDAPPATRMVSDGSAGSGSENSAVLEIPQVVNLADGAGATPSRASDVASASTSEDDDDGAPTSQDMAAAAGENDLVETGGRVGTLQDYENQPDNAGRATIFFLPGVAVARIPPPPLFNPAPRPVFSASRSMSPIILPPTSGGPFPSTSPMLMTPRFGSPSAFPAGGFRPAAFPRGGFGAFTSFRGGGLAGVHR